MSAEAQLKKLDELLAKVEQQVTRIEGKLKGSGSSGASSTGSSGGSSVAAKEFGNLVADHLPKFLEAANKIGGEVAQQSALFEKALNALQDAIGKAAETKKPANPNDLQAFFKNVSDLCGQITAVHEKARGHKHGQLLQAVSEANGAAFSWVFVEPAPVPFVEENRGAAEFYSNRVIRDQKGKDDVQVQWATSFNAFLKSLAPYIKQYHTTGLTWKK